MNKNKKELLTEELLQELRQSKSLDEFIQKHDKEISDIDVPTYLFQLLDKSGMTITQLIDKASIGRSLAYQVFNGQRSPNRNLLLRIALALKLSLEETQRLLRIARKGELYPRIQRDAAIIYSIEKKYSIIDTNEMLVNIGESILLKEE